MPKLVEAQTNDEASEHSGRTGEERRAATLARGARVITSGSQVQRRSASAPHAGASKDPRVGYLRRDIDDRAPAGLRRNRRARLSPAGWRSRRPFRSCGRGDTRERMQGRTQLPHSAAPAWRWEGGRGEWQWIFAIRPTHTGWCG